MFLGSCRKSGQEVCVQEFKNILWDHDEASGAGVARRIRGRRGLVKGSRKGNRGGPNGGNRIFVRPSFEAQQ